MPLAYHEDVDFEFFIPAAFVLLGLLTLVLYRRLREPADGADSRSNWAGTAAIGLAVLAAGLYGLAWIVPTEAETGIRRTIADVCLVATMLYALVVGPGLAGKAVQLVRTRGERRRALLAFFVGNAGLAWFVGAMVACTVTDACFH
jgi:protein-S-isoprenylcysteine O-methyltransferase Ste14